MTNRRRSPYLAITAISGLLVLTAISARGDDATLLPNAIQYFMDANGKPLANGKVFMYTPTTTTPKTTWTSADKATAQPQPFIPLGISGKPANPIYGDGSYRQLVKDQFNNTIWDFNTASTGGGSSGGGGTATGDGDLVGTIKPWAGLSAPNQYVFADGRELFRAFNSELFTAITLAQSAICTSGLNVLSGLADTKQIPIGGNVEASCIPPGTFVTAKAATSVTLSANASISTAITARFFLYGNGDGSTTFNVPNLSGRVAVGRNNMSGTPSANLISTYYGVIPDATGAAGGSQSLTLLLSNLPPITPAGTITNGAITSTFTGTTNQQALGPGGGSETFAGAGSLGHSAPSGTIVSTQATSTFAGNAGGGTSIPFSRVQPSLTLNYIIKVAPDANSSTASGVTSLGGMTGDIACGSGTLCTGNIISVTAPPIALPQTHILVGNAGNFAVDFGALATFSAGGTLNLNPPTATNTPGLIINQNSSSATVLGPYYANSNIGTFTGHLTGGGGAGGPETMHQFHVELYAGGPNYHTQSTGAGSFVVHHVLDDTAPGDMVGVGGFVDSVANRSQGKIYGIAGGASCDTNPNDPTKFCSVTAMLGQENDMFLLGTGTASYVVGYAALIGSTKAATTASAAYSILSAGGSISPWTRGILFSDRDLTNNTFTNAPIASTGHAIHFDYTGTIDTLINAPNVTMTNVFSTPGAFLTGPGLLTLGTTSTTTGGIVLLGSAGATLNFVVYNGATATWAQGYTATDSFFGAVTGPAAAAWRVNHATNLLSAESGLTVSGSFTATGLVTNADLVNAATTVNGQTCTLGSTCTIVAAATSIAYGTTTAGTSIGIPYNTTNGGTLAALTPVSGGVLYGQSATTPAFSAALTQFGVMFGGGAGGAPTGSTAGTAGQILVGQTSANASFKSAGGDVASISNAGSFTFAATNTHLTTLANLTTVGTLTSGAIGSGFTAIANSALANSSLTVNGTSIALGASGTVTAAAGTLTGTTLNSSVVTSSLTSVGALGSGSATTGFTVAASNVTWTGTLPSAQLPLATNAVIGGMRGDATTISCVAGVCTALGAAATSIDAGGATTSVANGVTNNLLYDLGGFVKVLATANSSVLITNGSGAPSWSTTLPSSLSASTMALANPAFSGTVTGSNTIPLTILAQSAANTMLGNWTGSTANVVANAMPSCADSGGNHLNYVSGTGVTCGTSVGAAAAGTLTGATLAAGVTASSLTSLGTLVADLTLSKANPSIFINKTASGQDNVIAGQLSGQNRFAIDAGNSNAESTANAGSNFDINRYSDAGSYLGTPLNINRATGAVTLANTLTIQGIASDTATTDNTMCITSAGLTLKGSGTLGICLGTSGAQFKTAFAPMVAGIDDLMKINFQNYRYLDGFGDSGARMQYGTTAQDVERVIPDLVRYDDKGNALNYDSGALLFIGLRAIQQLKISNDNLREEITKLKRAAK